MQTEFFFNSHPPSGTAARRGEKEAGEVINVIEVARGEIAEGCNHYARNYKGENTIPCLNFRARIRMCRYASPEGLGEEIVGKVPKVDKGVYL